MNDKSDSDSLFLEHSNTLTPSNAHVQGFPLPTFAGGSSENKGLMERATTQPLAHLSNLLVSK